MTEEALKITRLSKNATIPTYAKPGDAGLDLSASESITLEPGGRNVVGTGLAIALPEGHVGLLHPRSGLAFKEGVTVLNAPGTIDAGYRGEVSVILYNAGDSPYTVEVGDRIAQLVIQRFERPVIEEVKKLDETKRGQGGFGSTGK